MKPTNLKNNTLFLILILLLATVLRFWDINKVPVSLFGDELDIGYHAYSLLKTGRDYSGNFLPLHLQSIADYKSSLYAYSIIPTVGIFGISPLGVRLPSAFFGILSVYLFYLLVNLVFRNKPLALIAALLLAISPWHLQFSRGGFEVVEMLALYMAGLYFFLKSLGNGKWLVPAALCFALTPIAYHSGKVVMPLTVLALSVIYFKQLLKVQKKNLILSAAVFLLITIPFVWSTLFGGGLDRFGSTSVFQVPNLSSIIGFERLKDAIRRDPKAQAGVAPALSDKFFHNKIVYFGSVLANNYLGAFSSEFLFTAGDPSLRHTPEGEGQFYKYQAVFIVLGLVFFFLRFGDIKTKLLFSFWTLIAPLPSILTKDGGNHAIRLFFLLPPLLIFASAGIYYSVVTLSGRFRKLFAVGLASVMFLSFIFYQHNYWIHYPWDSQIWWHAGFEEAIQSAVSEGKKYDKVIISGANEPPLIFFLAWSSYPPQSFQQKYPLAEDKLEGFGKVLRLDKYYFPPIGAGKSLYELGSILPDKTLYLATAKEINLDLIREPQRVPSDITLIKSISYPSGDPAFYLFTKSSKR